MSLHSPASVWARHMPMYCIVWMLLVHPLATRADDWPAWRGPNNNGVSAEKNLPVKWSAQDNIAWKVKLPGLGTSSPIVWQDRIFVTSQIGSGPVRSATDADKLAQKGDARITLVVQCFQSSDGRPLWDYQTNAEDGYSPSHPMSATLAMPSCVTDGERVVAWFASGQVICLTLEGKLIWQRNPAKEYSAFKLRWGHSSSPTLYKNLLFLLCDHDPTAYLLAVDKRTGKTVWKAERGRKLRSYSTPLVINVDDREQVIINSNPRIDAYGAADGRPLWHAGGWCKVPVPMPVFADDVLYLNRGSNGGPYMAIQPGNSRRDTPGRILWKSPTGGSYVSSLLVYRGLIYMASEHGIVRCVDPKTGQRVWSMRAGGKFWASPVAADGKIYLLSEAGETVVLAQGREPLVLARNALGERCVASPAIAGGRIYVRSDEHLFCIGASRPSNKGK